ncbi:MAG: YggS family pyridoxal phosphate-dependent enzyme [Pacificimonas sp.]|jgi:pyridoxal phosphate enzyme (YggS family)|nr:YggS family pyridoxal phosphate-dependent enzyme [Pacificimonas sp.]
MARAADRLADVTARIAKAATLAGREAGEVTLIAVSKTHDAEAIRPLLDAGHRDFGENRVQEAQLKWPALLKEFPDARLHMIGQLQSNKAEDAAALFDVIHSVDRKSLVKALGKAVEQVGRTPETFLQVDIGDEDQKGGCPIDGIDALAEQMRAAGVAPTGLMCIPPAGTESAPYFALLRKLRDERGLPGLSMGMSADFETAVMLGATHVRVGTALFGARG